MATNATTTNTRPLTQIVAGLQFFCGRHMNAVVTTDNVLALGFYIERQIWVVVDLNAQRPMVCVRAGSIPIKNKKTPVRLFLEAHFINRNLVEVQTKLGFGRVMELNFGNGYMIEIRLFPRGQNVLVRAEKKSISWNKPHELKTAELYEAGPDITNEDALMDLMMLGDKWCAQIDNDQTSKVAADNGHETQVILARQKLEKALHKLRFETAKIDPEIWFEAGEFLKTNGLAVAKEKFPDQVNDKESLAQNLKKIFETAKNKQAKRQRAQARILAMENQISGNDVLRKETPKNAEIEGVLKSAGANGRTFILGQKHTFFVGKSANDNLALLRKAKPWHYWLHLKDFPGCHGILMRNKSEVVPDSILNQAAQHLLEKQWGAKANDRRGDIFDILIAEVRRVKPMKGDRLGRVTHTHARTLAVRMLMFCIVVFSALIELDQGLAQNAKSTSPDVTVDVPPKSSQKDSEMDFGKPVDSKITSGESKNSDAPSNPLAPTTWFGARAQVETQYPYFLGVGAVLDVFESFELRLGVGYTPSSYVKAVGGYIADYGGVDAYKDLVQAALEDNSSLRLQAAYNFGGDVAGWKIMTAMTFLSSEGDAEIDEVLGAATGRDFTTLKNLLIAIGRPTSVALESEISLAEFSVGYGWQLNNHLIITASAGALSILEAEIKIKTGLPNFEASNAGQTLLRESEQELEDIVTENGVSPLIGLSVGYRF